MTKKKDFSMTGVTFSGTCLTITKQAFPELLDEIVNTCDGDMDDGVKLNERFGILSGWTYQGMSWEGSPRHDSDTTTRSITFTSPEGVNYYGEFDTNLCVGDPFDDVELKAQK